MAAGARAAARYMPGNGTTRLSANERNPRRRAPFPRLSPHIGTAPKGGIVRMVARSTPRGRVIPMHPVEAGHIT